MRSKAAFIFAAEVSPSTFVALNASTRAVAGLAMDAVGRMGELCGSEVGVVVIGAGDAGGGSEGIDTGAAMRAVGADSSETMPTTVASAGSTVR